MSGFKNSPFSKRLRASHRDGDADEGDSPKKGRPKPLFGGNNGSGAAASSSSSSTPGLTLDAATSDSSSQPPESPTEGTHKFSFAAANSAARMPRIQKDYGDRFVPSKDLGDLRTSYHLMDEAGGPSTPSKNRIIPSESDALKEQANSIFNSILHTEVTPPSPVRRPVSPTRPTTTNSTTLPSTPTKRRLFQYSSPSRSSTSNTTHTTDSNTTTTPTRRLDTPTSEAYSLSPVRAHSHALLASPRPSPRSVCKTPYRVLDAPELADDFYLNLVDWSSTNILGVGLGTCVYLWTASNASVSKLCDLSALPSASTSTSIPDTVSSVSWVQKGTTLAVGTVCGRLYIYDATTLSLQRTYTQAHAQRIGALAWNRHVVSSGSRDRMVYHRDVREKSSRPFRRGLGHRQEVCGLKWSNSGSGDGLGGGGGAMLASGGNDNKVCIWDLRGSARANASGDPTEEVPAGDTPPLYKFHEHTAAVKALAWDPHMSGVLATGGGTQDKHIRFWNTANGSMLNQLDTGSQVCNLIWSLTSHELVSTHGFSSTTAQNQICIWKYPTLNMVASLTGHTNRVLYLAMSPEGETIVTGAGDETLRFWNAFPKMDRGGRGRRGEGVLDYVGKIR
ncbi:WD40-repeat-containing domain protein [Crepidotus variabilis]|uniref:WD40-repeat-containing domain protein n=1 Tax=Crepidotus variabilis TaxID=179855 RepID=A0A9P6E915_9AGAR|nr:WD40-repeat-containing domain protein [Crepidotus variabilis]